MGKLFKDNVVFQDGKMVVLEESGVVAETIATSDTKQFFTTAINTFFMQDDPDVDRQWEQLYRVIPGRGHGELLPFRPPDTTATVQGATGGGGNAITADQNGSHGIVFNEVGEGGEIKFSRVTSAEKYVRHIKYGTAIGYSNEWFSDGSMGLIEMVTEDFRRSAQERLAAIHYGAIAAACNAGISSSLGYTAAASGSAVAGLINTLNTITSTMRRAKRRPTHLVIAPENEQPLRLAFKHTQAGGSTSSVQNDFTSRLQFIVTEFAASGSGYVVEAKKRLISTNRLPLSLGNFEDLLRDSEVLVGKFRRGVLVAEGAVIHRVTSLPTAIDAAVDI